MLYAILNTKTGRLLKVEAEKQTRCYDWEKPYDVAVMRVYDSSFHGTVYVTDDKRSAYDLLKPVPADRKYPRYEDVLLDCNGFTRKDLKVVNLVQKKSGGKNSSSAIQPGQP